MTPEEIAEEVADKVEKLCAEYNCEIGVWLSWRDILHNFDAMKANPELNELNFGLQIRIHGTESNSTAHKNLESKS